MHITRNINQETKQKLVINDGSDMRKYTLCLDESLCHELRDLQVHLFCTSCKETVILPIGKIADITLPKGFTSLEMDLFVKGVCDKCKI
jgi:Fur family ferric uptake transcriptional regulator